MDYLLIHFIFSDNAESFCETDVYKRQSEDSGLDVVKEENIV